VPLVGPSLLVACVSERYKTAIHSAKIFGRYEWSNPRDVTKVALVATVVLVAVAVALTAAVVNCSWP